nr:hypothetical protein [Tanacetum cinerariifolium]
AHDALLESSSSKPQDHCSTEVPEGSGNPNPIASTSNPPADPMEILTVESHIPTVSSPVPTAYSTDSQEPSSDARLISKRVANQEETPSLDNILSLTNRVEYILGVTKNSEESNGVEADISNMETAITASPTPTLRIHKDHPKRVRPIGTNVLKNKKDERGIVIKNKARLVAQGYTQEEGIDYDEVFAPVARIKAITLFLACASFIEFPAKLYKVEKAMYGLHQAPRAGYGTLSKYLLKNGFQRGTIHQTLFIRRQRGDFILIQVYVYDIIFGSSNPQLCREFEALMHEKFQMSAMGELNFFLGLQVLQKEDGIFLSQDNNSIMARLQFCDYHNMVAILEKSEHNVDFHFMVDFIEAYPLRTTITESSLRRNPKLNDEEGISSLPDTELFENLTLMGYNISLNQKFIFQKGQFSHQWKYLIHTIMQCMSPKSTGFNVFSSNIATALVCLATNMTYNFSKMIFDGLVKNINNKGEGSGTPTEPHHTPSLEAQPPSPTTHSSPTLPPVTTTSIPVVTSSETTPIRQYTRRVRIVQSSALPSLRDVSQGEACPTDFGFIADQDRATIAKSSILPYDSAPRVTSPAADEGSMQQTISELTALCTSLQRQTSSYLLNFKLKRSRDDALIKGMSLDQEEAAAERISYDSEEMATVLTSMDAATVLVGGIADVPIGSGSIPTASPPTDELPTGSVMVPTASPVFATATVVTPYRRKKGKEVMVESDTPKKQKVQEQIDAQVAIELEEKLEREDQRSQQRKPWTKKQKRDYYMAVIRSNLGWKMEDFVPMGSKEEAERFKRKGISFEQESVKKQKISEEVPEEVKSHDEVPEEKVKEMIQLVPIEEVYVEALQVKHPIINGKVYHEGQRSYWKITRLRGSSAREAAAERISYDSEEMATVLTSMDAATVLVGGIADVPIGSGSVPTASPPADELPTGSDVVPTKVQEQIDAQVARELEEKLEREDQRRNIETIAKYLQEYHQFVSELPIERRIELISDLIKYQDNYAKIYKFQSQQRKPWTKKQKRDYYMAVIRSNLGWKMEDFVPMGSKEEAKTFKRKGISFEQKSVKKQKISEEVPEEVKSHDEVPEEKRSYWKITRLGGSSASYQFFIDLLKHLDREVLNQLWRLVKETLSNRPPTSDKEMEL